MWICRLFGRPAVALLNGQPKGKLPLVREAACSSARRTFCNIDSKGSSTKKVEPELTREEVERLAERARNQERAWKLMVPEANMGITHPAIPAMIVLCLGLQWTISQQCEEVDEKERMQSSEILARKREERSKIRGSTEA
eukprot:gnl/MRDRNA2_/MRDRNA2_55147_c0_seq1.p1 gnl/MRDRNA2_/MRDRNA2_55147_c0~~gnl/MRDRNA2_/MRDRNA2_55147_c0_seq1.p1  ORF type:complete len:140 (+),score=27.37 gnl/MRDRNA2_/MRDRNA2_55147_c0_seq1:70-489(+)